MPGHAARFALFGCLLGALASSTLPDAMRLAPPALGGLIGAIIISASLLLETRRLQRRLRGWPYLLAQLARVGFYLLIATITLIAAALIRSASPQVDSAHTQFVLFGGTVYRLVAFWTLILMAINLGRQTARLLGPGRLWRLITGRYHWPVEEQRLFLYVDMNDSTAIAERLGSERWHGLIHDCFVDMSEAISATGGEIHQYVGDEVQITWLLERGVRNADCLRCVFEITKALQRRRRYYERTYGVIPEFKAAAHAGPVVTGEIGETRRDIVFNGSAVGATSAILGECHAFDSSFLVSSSVVDALGPNPGNFDIAVVGSVELGGGAERIPVSAVAARPEAAAL